MSWEGRRPDWMVGRPSCWQHHGRAGENLLSVFSFGEQPLLDPTQPRQDGASGQEPPVGRALFPAGPLGCPWDQQSHRDSAGILRGFPPLLRGLPTVAWEFQPRPPRGLGWWEGGRCLEAELCSQLAVHEPWGSKVKRLGGGWG